MEESKATTATGVNDAPEIANSQGTIQAADPSEGATPNVLTGTAGASTAAGAATAKQGSAQDDPFCTLYVKGVTPGIGEPDLRAALETDGSIEKCIIPIGHDKKPTGIAFVKFYSREEALRVADLHKSVLVNGISLDISKYNGEAKDPVNQSAKFLNIPENYGREELITLFSSFGTVSEVKLNDDGDSGVVFYSTPGSVTKAVQTLNGKVMDGGKVFMVSADKNAEKHNNTQYNNLYVGNVSTYATEEEIRGVFSKFGEIESLLLPTRKIKNEAGELVDIRKPFIFISFKKSKNASDVIKELDTRTYWGKDLDIDYYDPNRKKTNKEKYNPSSTAAPSAPNQGVANEFFSAMANMMTQFSNMNMRGRGGMGGQGGNYRGGQSSNYRGRGGRGNPRGRGGQRGGHRGSNNYYNVRSQYDQPKPQYNGYPGAGVQSYGSMPPAMAPATQPMQAPSYVQPEVSMPQPPMGGSMPPMAGQQPPAPVVQDPTPVQDDDVNVLALPADQYKANENEIGTFLYTKIEVKHGEQMAGKMTGMFLDLSPEEIYQIIHDPATYERYIQEATEMINDEDAEEQAE